MYQVKLGREYLYEHVSIPSKLKGGGNWTGWAFEIMDMVADKLNFRCD